MGRTVAIVGAGQAGFQVAASLREGGFDGAIRLYGEETWLPYQRPPLSKTYLKEDASPDKMYFRAERFFAEKSIEVVTGARVARIDRARHTLRLGNGTEVGWDHLVIATGVRNRALPVEGIGLEGVVMLRGLDDAHQIRAHIARSPRILIIGGGVIGLEMSALARSLGYEVDIVELGDRLCGRIGTAALSEYFLHFHRGLGSRVHLGASVAGLEGRDGKLAGARLSTGQRIAASMALVCIGVIPNTELATDAGLEVSDGIVVDPYMRTSDPAVLAAGDCTRFKPPFGAIDGTIRLESVQNAIDQGRTVADTILGRNKPYDALPWFWSDQGSCKLQIAGLVQGHDRVVLKADPEKGAMTVYAFAGDALIGVECVNRPADFVAARRVLGLRKRVTPAEVEKPDFELRKLMS